MQGRPGIYGNTRAGVQEAEGTGRVTRRMAVAVDSRCESKNTGRTRRQASRNTTNKSNERTPTGGEEVGEGGGRREREEEGKDGRLERESNRNPSVIALTTTRSIASAARSTR